MRSEADRQVGAYSGGFKYYAKVLSLDVWTLNNFQQRSDVQFCISERSIRQKCGEKFGWRDKEVRG